MAPEPEPRIAIIGAGIGGLCLAQALTRAGLTCDVYERDPSPSFRSQGYRIGINAQGLRSLRACLPEHLFELITATSSRPVTGGMVLYDPQLAELGAWRSSPPGQPSATDSYQLVDRHTFRQILMHGLGSRLHFDSALQTIEQTDNAVVARFANGSSAIADLVVGADGVGSATRRWLLPSAGVSTTSLLVYGRTPLGPDRFAAPAWVANRGMAIVGAPDGNRLTVGPFLKREPFAAATARWAPDLQLTEIPDYLFWAFQGPHAWLRREADARVGLDPATLHARVREVIATWHPDLPAVVEHADVEATFLTALHAAEPVAAWPTTRVTLLGDAIHAMTPLGGEGANTALRDAEVLTQQLLSAGAAGEPLLSAVGAYESAMLDYGFAAVARSLSTPLFRERFGLRNGA